MCIFHKFGKWENFDREVAERRITKNWGLCGLTRHMQRKTCIKCGLVKEREISVSVHKG